MLITIEWKRMVKRCTSTNKALKHHGGNKIPLGAIDTFLEDINAAAQVLISDLSPGFTFYEETSNILQSSQNNHAYVAVTTGNMESIESFITLMLKDEEYYTHGNDEVRIGIFNTFLKLLVKDIVRLNRVAFKLINKDNIHSKALPKLNEVTMTIMFMGFGYIEHNDLKEGYFDLYLKIISIYRLKHDSHLVMIMFGALRRMIINDKSQSLFDHLMHNFIPDNIDLPLYNRIICTYHKFKRIPTKNEIRVLNQKLVA